MQFTKDFKQAIRAGRVSCSFRAWKSPQARVGGRYNLHPTGRLTDRGVTVLRESGQPGELGEPRESGELGRS